MQQVEFRRFPMELRVEDDEEGGVTLSGHIAVFDELSKDLGGFKEKIDPGAFVDSLKRDDIPALWNHDAGLVLGRVKAGTLELKEDKTGLAFRNKPPDTTWLKDRLVSVKRGDVSGASFGFITEKDVWEDARSEDEDDDTKLKIRTLQRVRLIEVSPGVTFPAYPQTDIAVRSMERWAAGHSTDSVVDMELKKRRLRLQELAS